MGLRQQASHGALAKRTEVIGEICPQLLRNAMSVANCQCPVSQWAIEGVVRYEFLQFTGGVGPVLLHNDGIRILA